MTKPFNIHDWQAKQRLTESLNPEISRSLDKFITAMADRYDYSMQDAVYAIMAALKQRNYDGVNESRMDTPGGNPDYFYDKDSIFGKLKKDPDYIKKVNAKNSKNNWEDPRDYNSKKDFLPKQEHHNDEDFPGKDLSAWDLLDKLKSGDSELYNNVEDFMKSMKEMSTTGTGASFNAGSGEGYMTPNAFKKKKK
jgi:hypothetical protein